ncbi:uncharacterized protein PG986_004626 [Apiospora aurea]|uniref:Uncharacterized protein n=1 Tax=Apiospora aurea TaxID=335848 RepID=A0ABR1QNM4_9PEZI
MSTLVGPVSAVLLVLALGWFDYAPGTAFSNLKSPILYRISRDLAWRPTMHADEDDEQTGVCTEGYGIYMSACPARGFREINDWVRDWAATDLNSSPTFQSTTSDIGRQLRPTQAAEKPSVVLSTTPSEFLLQSIGLMKNYIGNTNLYDKLIFMASETVYFPTDDLNCMGDEDCQSLQESPYSFSPNASFFSNSTNLDSDLSHYFVDYDGTSLVYLTGQIPDAVVGRQGTKVYMCSMVASWIPANFTFDQTANDELVSTAGSDQSMQAVFREHPAASRVVRFDDAWLRLLNPTLVNTTDAEWTALDALTGHFSTDTTQQGDHKQYTTMAAHEGNDTAAALFLAKVFGMYLTEALARTSTTWRTVVKLSRNETSLSYANLDYQHHPIWSVNNITVHNVTHVWDHEGGQALNTTLEAFDRALDEGSLPIALEAQRYGYGTGQQRKTLHFAQAIISIYLGTVLLYAAAISVGHVLELCRMRGSRGDRIRVLSVAAWSDLQDLMMLALKTPAPGGDLADAGAGVTSAQTWKKIVRARADEMDRV